VAAHKLQRVEWVVALLATAAAVLLTFAFALHAGGLWRDEVNSLNVALSPSLSELWRLLEFESAPALWLLLLRGWLALFGSSSDLGLRLLGALGGLAVPAAVWFAALRLGRSVPLVSLALLAVNPEVIRWAASLRAWGLGAALAVVALVFVREAAAAPSRRRILLGALFAVLSVQCVYQNAVLLAAAVAGATSVALAERRWKRAVVPLAIGMTAAVSLLPYVPTLRRIGEWSMLNQAPVTLRYLAVQGGAVFAASGTAVLACWIAVLCLALALGGWRISSSGSGRRGERGDVALFAIVTGLAAVVGFAVFLLRVRYPTQPWYYVGLVAVVAVCAEAAIASSLCSRALRIARVSLALLALLAGSAGAWTSLRARHTNLDVIAAHLETHAVRGDLIVVNPWYYAISLDRYYHGEADVTTIPPLEDVRVHRFDLIKEKMQSVGAMDPLQERTRQVLQSGRRVWIVGGFATPPGKTSPRSLPPPPLPDTGWDSEPYRVVWTLQLAARLSDHVTEATRIPIEVPSGPLETAGLLVIRGWQ
jgi:uncharacterized membrane protein